MIDDLVPDLFSGERSNTSLKKVSFAPSSEAVSYLSNQMDSSCIESFDFSSVLVLLTPTAGQLSEGV